jgi:hypothetical protein
MADSFTTFLQVRLPATGAYDNTWGATLNADALNLLDTAITGWTAINIGSATSFALPALTPGVVSNSRFFSLLLVGSPPTGNVTITVPSSVPGKMFLINNQTGQPLVFTYSDSTSTVTVNNGEIRLIWCDGTNCFEVIAGASSANSLNGVPAANWMRQSRTAAEILADTIVLNECTIPTSFPFTSVTEGPTTTIDCNNGNSQALTLTGNRVMAAPVNVEDGMKIDLLVIQDGTGNRTLNWNAVFLFANGISPVLGTGPGAVDKFGLLYNATLNKWLVSQTQNLNAGSGTTLPITISQNTLDWNLKAIVGTLSAPATINVLVAQGVIVQASNAKTAAMDFSGLISGCTINLINLGYIIGKGGDGGDGAMASFPGSGATVQCATNGKPGGPAILGPGSGCTFNITNAGGQIWGGGGGGGAGGAYDGFASGNGLGNAGGGGGGAGGGKGGRGGRGVMITGGSTQGQDGGDASTGPNGAPGTAGSGSSNGAGGFGTSQLGGTYGVAGVNGTNPSTATVGHTGPFSNGGAAGNAIALAGGTAVFVSGGSSPNVLGAVS